MQKNDSMLPKSNRENTAQIATGLLDTGVDYEITGGRTADNHACLLTLKQIEVFGSVFTDLTTRELSERLSTDGLVQQAGIAYHVAPAFRQSLLDLVRKARRNPKASTVVQSITVQWSYTVHCFIGQDPKELAQMVADWLPADVELNLNSLRELKRDHGRKVGFAAKDKAKLRGQMITLEILEQLEQAGGTVAEDFVEKDTVVPPFSSDSLREQGVTPAVAYLMLYCRRVLSKRPQPSHKDRATYVEYLPQFFQQLAACTDLEDIRSHGPLQATIQHLRDDNVVGRAFRSLVGAMRTEQRYYPTRILKIMNSLPDGDDQAWVAMQKMLATRRYDQQHDSTEPPYPTRTVKRLSELQRIGPVVPETDIEVLVERFGFTGVEIGKWIRTSELQPLLQWIIASCYDLESLLGPWFPAVVRRGNLALAIGARGHGRGCAHYESSLRVINLTRLRGDGSLAHEFAHFFDNYFSTRFSQGTERYLSERLTKHLAPDSRAESAITQKVDGVLGAIGLTAAQHAFVGSPKPRRWYRQHFILRAWEASGKQPQQAFDLAVAQEANFLSGRYAAGRAQCLADSLAKWTEQEINVQARVPQETNFLQQARTLGKYWKSPCELFARVFEAWCEDELAQRGLLNEYLVSGTLRDYSRCRGWPYPVAEERQAIHQAITQFIAVCEP